MGQKPGYFIPLYCGLRDDTKLIRTAMLLKAEDRDLVRAKIENLWMWAMMQRPNGIIEAEMTEDEIASNCNWKGDPKLWLSVLIDRHWLDREQDGSLKIHDWELYGGKLAESREYHRKHAEASRSGLVRVFDRCASPSVVAKAKAIEELQRQGIDDAAIRDSASNPDRKSWDFWAHIRALTPNHKPKIETPF